MKKNAGLMAQHSVRLAALSAMLFALCVSAQAQEAKKLPRIAFLSATSASANSARIDAFPQGLRDFGFVEGQNIFIEWRWAEGKFDQLSSLAAELVRLNVDVIVSSGPSPTRFSSRLPLRSLS